MSWNLITCFKNKTLVLKITKQDHHQTWGYRISNASIIRLVHRYINTLEKYICVCVLVFVQPEWKATCCVALINCRYVDAVCFLTALCVVVMLWSSSSTHPKEIFFVPEFFFFFFFFYKNLCMKESLYVIWLLKSKYISWYSHVLCCICH